MRLPSVAVSLVFASAVLSAQTNQPVIPTNDAQRLGLQGPVKSVLKKSDHTVSSIRYVGASQPLVCSVPYRGFEFQSPVMGQVSSEPVFNRPSCATLPTAPAGRRDLAQMPLPVPSSGAGWQVFDVAGMIIEQGTVDREGIVSHITKIQRDANEREISRVLNANSNHPEVRVTTPAPVHDPNASEVKDTFGSSGKLLLHSEGTMYSGETRFYNAKGEPDGDRIEQADANTFTRTVRGADGKVVHKTVERKDDKGILTEWSDYDGNDKLIHSMRFADGKLAYGYEDPFLTTPFMFGVKTLGKGTSYMWVIFPGGGWETWVTNHPNSFASDPDNIERVDQNGVVQERLSMEYVRDARGNWTSMKASDWKRANNKTVVVQTDTRVIEYYQ